VTSFVCQEGDLSSSCKEPCQFGAIWSAHQCRRSSLKYEMLT
jgi:hypothetical protein